MSNQFSTFWLLILMLISIGSHCWAGQPDPIFQNIKTAALSRDGTLLALSQRNSDIVLIDTASGRIQHVLKGCGCTVYAIALSPGGRLLAAYTIVCSGAIYHWEAKIWDSRTGKLRHTLVTHNIGPYKAGHYDLGFTIDGYLANTTGEDAYIHLWNISTGKQTRLSRSSRFFFSSDGTVVPMTTALTSILTRFPPTIPLEFCTFSQDNRFLLTISGKNTLNGDVSSDDGPGKAAVLWDALSGKQLRTFPLEGHSAYSASMRGDKVFIGGSDFARVWNLTNGKMQDLWHTPSSSDKFDWFGNSHVVWARLTQSGKEADLIAIRIKPVVYKNPHEYHAVSYTEEADFVRTDAMTGQHKSALGLKSW